LHALRWQASGTGAWRLIEDEDLDIEHSLATLAANRDQKQITG
jgi:hypothetical protein